MSPEKEKEKKNKECLGQRVLEKEKAENIPVTVINDDII